MVSVNEVYELLNVIARKSFNGGFNPAQFNIAAQSGQLAYYNKCLGKDEVSSGNKYIDNYFSNSTQSNIDKLRPFLKVVNIGVIAGAFPMPQDYVQIAGCRYKYFENNIQKQVEVQQLTAGQLGTVLNSELMYPDLKHPKMIELNGYFKVYPDTLPQVEFDYYRLPIPPVWNFTLVNNRPVFDPNTSVNFDFPDENKNILTFIVGNLLGISIKDPDLINFTEQKIRTGA